MRICLLGAGFNAAFYAQTLLRYRSRDRLTAVYSRTAASAQRFAQKWHVPFATTDLYAAVGHPESEVVVISLPNHLHAEAVRAAAAAGKPVLCTKPLGRTADEALSMLRDVEQAGVFHGYLEDLVYTPKTLQARQAVREGAVGDVLWVRSRETHPGPHSDWFWNRDCSGGGAILDLGCHCVEIARQFIGKNVRPVEVMCWAATQVHPVDVEDHAIGLVRYENGAIGQFEVSWCFRGGMDLRDEIAGREGTIFLNHWLRTGFEMYSSGNQRGYIAEKAESASGWLFPVGDEPGALGYTEMFADMLDALEQNREPAETFYDGYVVNAILDAAYRSAHSKSWEPIALADWRGEAESRLDAAQHDYDDEHILLKQERLPDGSIKILLRHKQTGVIVQRTLES